jgi:hypothetical protein
MQDSKRPETNQQHLLYSSLSLSERCVHDGPSALLFVCPTGQVGIGHVRYPTAESASAQEAQPIEM